LLTHLQLPYVNQYRDKHKASQSSHESLYKLAIGLYANILHIYVESSMGIRFYQHMVRPYAKLVVASLSTFT